MRHRIFSLVVVGVLLLAMAATASAQVATTGRVDQITGFAQMQGVPAVASGTFMPQIQAIDATAASQGTVLVPYLQDLDAYFASHFGWRSSRPVSILLYSNTNDLTNGVLGFSPTMTPDQAIVIQSRPAFFFMVNQTNPAFPGISVGSYVIAVNTDVDAAALQFNALANAFNSSVGTGHLVPTSSSAQGQNTSMNGMLMIEGSIARQYALLMEADLSSNTTALPTWFQAGLADAISYSIVPGLPQESGRSLAVAHFQQSTGGTLPTLDQLTTGVSGVPFDVIRGIGFLGAENILTKLGPAGIVTLLQRVGSGQAFDFELQQIGGFNVSAANTQYKSLIPSL